MTLHDGSQAVLCGVPQGAQRIREWGRPARAAASATGKAYINFLGNEGQERVRAAYGAAKYERLVELKTRYDPENVFRINQNIPTRTTSTPG